MGSNNKLLEIIPENTPLEASFAVADDILRQGVVGISEIIVRPGLINVDFADVRSVMHNSGSALMGIGTGTGKNGAEEAAAAAISSPLLESYTRLYMKMLMLYSVVSSMNPLKMILLL